MQITRETAPEPSETIPEAEEKSEPLTDGVDTKPVEPGMRLDNRSVLFRVVGMDAAKKITTCWTHKIQPPVGTGWSKWPSEMPKVSA